MWICNFTDAFGITPERTEELIQMVASALNGNSVADGPRLIIRLVEKEQMPLNEAVVCGVMLMIVME